MGGVMRSMATWCFGGVLALVGGGAWAADGANPAPSEVLPLPGSAGGEGQGIAGAEHPSPPNPVEELTKYAQKCRTENDCRESVCQDPEVPNICQLADADLAALALVADPQFVHGMILDAEEKQAEAKRKRALDENERIKKAGGGRFHPLTDEDRRTAARLSALESGPLPSLALGAATAGGVTGLAGRTVEQQVALAAAGLARLIQDRAKQESAAWALDTVGEKICDAGAQQSLLKDLPEPDQQEIRDELLRSFCGLALSDRLGGYGAGQETLELLQDAVNDDVRDLPGAISGKVLTETVDRGYVAHDPYASQTERKLAAARSEGKRVIELYDTIDPLLQVVQHWSGEETGAVLSRKEAESLEMESADADKAQNDATAELEGSRNRWSPIRSRLDQDQKLALKVIGNVADVNKAAGELCGDSKGRCWSRANEEPWTAERALVASRDSAIAWSEAGKQASEAILVCRDTNKAVSACLSKMEPLSGNWRRWDGALEELQKLEPTASLPDAASAFGRALSDAVLAVAGAYQFDDHRLGKLSEALGPAARSLDQEKVASLVTAIQAAQAHSDAYLAAHRVDDLLAQASQVLSTKLTAYEADTLREDWRVDVRRIVDGTDPLFAMGQMAGDLDRWNRRVVGVSGVLKLPEAEIAACALSLPEALQGAQTQLGAKQLGPSSFAAALTASQPCWTIFGKGRLVSSLGELNTNLTNDYLAIDEPSLPGRLERLSTAFRLYTQLATPGTTLAARWQHLQDLEKRIQEATKEFDARSAALIASLQEKGLGKQDIEALREALRQQSEGGRQLLLLQVELAETALNIGQIVLDTARDAPNQLMGLCTYRDPLDQCVNVIQAPDLSKADAALDGFRQALAAMRDVLGGQPVRALLDGVRQLDIDCGKAKDEDKCIQARDQLTAWFGALAALSDAEDADAAARALDAVVNPPGGWRIKQDPHSFTLSVGSHAGFMLGRERRWGTYGLVRERGEDVYPVAPTLSLPVGLDFSWACTKHRWNGGLFVSLLDPAAFLQYDVQEGGALPDPNLMTVLAPGLAGRIGIPTTPFGVLVGGVYRPNLRSVSEPGFASTGANAMQYYLAATVDVTLWSLYRQHLKGGE